MTRRIYSSLFLCTGNSARSILAEALLGRLGAGRHRAFSAGSHPKGEVHPMAIEVLRERGFETAGFRSKSWEVFAGDGANPIDFVFTVCDNARGEACPVWPGRPISAHWGIEDPAACTGPEEEQRRVFLRAYRELERRIELFANLSIDGLDRLSLQSALDEIGRLKPLAGEES